MASPATSRGRRRPLPAGPQCDRCDPSGELPGGFFARATSDESGHFTLENVPAGTDIPMIIQIGKWRRKELLPMVNKCTDNPLPANLTSLPKNTSEGDLPKIAVASADCDALECLIRRLGVSDYEFTSGSGTGSIHIYNASGGFTNAGGETTTPATTLWGDPAKLAQFSSFLNAPDLADPDLAYVDERGQRRPARPDERPVIAGTALPVREEVRS